jgi:hypothetical protein
MKLAQFPRSRFRSTLRLTSHRFGHWRVSCRCSAESPPSRSAKGIQDNSFSSKKRTIRSPGFAAHIQPAIDFTNGSREIAPSFTQEWPVFSPDSTSSRTRFRTSLRKTDNGMEDMRLNYRLQAFMEDKYTPGVRAAFIACAFRPRQATRASATGRGGL